MYTEIKTFEDACKVLNIDASNVLPDFSLFPKEEQGAMQAHAKLILIAKAVKGDWIPDWENSNQCKYFTWFIMGSASGVGFSYYGYAAWSASSDVGSRLCFESREKAIYVGKTFEELYKKYFVKG